MKRLLNITFLLFVLLSMMGLNASAYDISVKNADGKTIYYNFIYFIHDNTELAVTYNSSDEYSNKVVIPESVIYNNKTYSVTRIGEDAFHGCSGLTSVTIPNSVTSIGSSAFYGCGKLTSVTIPNSVKSIESSTFRDCSGLKSVTIPNSVTSIGSSAFYGCDGLTSVTIPNNVKSIGNYAFYGCDGLTSVTIPNSVTSIGVGAFWSCGLTSVTIPNSSIRESSFFCCAKLSSVTIGSGVTSIEKSAFLGCSGLTSIKVQEGNTKYDSRNNCNAIIETATNTLVTGCKNTIIPNSVTRIEENAFYGCLGLTSVTIPNSVKSIGGSAFYGCSRLTSVTIGNSVTSIGGSAFSGCSRLTAIYSNIAAPTNATGSSFDNSTYSDATLYVPYGTKDKYLATEGWKNFANIGYTSYIGGIYYGFLEAEATVVSGANKYTGSITIPTSVNSYGKTYSVTSIGGGAFDGCSGLTSVSIPNSVKSIGGGAFWGCSGLTSITIPNSVTSIGNWAFYDCTGLTSISVQEGNTKYDSRNNCNAIIETATNTLVTGCKNTIIPNNVTSIGVGAFWGCSGLTSVTIPNSVTSIGGSAFSGCSKLTAIYSNIAAPTNATGSSFDNSTYSDATLYVPYGTKDKYLAKEGWKNFKYIKEDKNIGVCGNNLTYTYSSGELTIHGTGAMYDYSKSSPVPWDSYKNDIIKIVIEDGARSIGDYAFSGCSNLYSITIPNSVTSIGERAFYSCGQTSITIPNSVKSIGRYAFSNCDGLTSVTIGNSVTSIGYCAFQCCSRLTSITIPNSVTSIGEGAFAGCSGLTSVTFHCNNVGTWFSVLSSIKEIWIEKEVTSIAQQSFRGCSGLQSVYNNAKDAFTIAKNTFDDATYSKAKLYVPTGMKATYEETPWWVNFKKIEEMSGKYILTYKVDGEVYKQYEVAYGSTITPEPAPTKEGYIFSGWSEIPTTMPARDVTVTGTFTAKYTLTYKVDGEVYKQYEVAYGSAITPEPAPSKTGYTFSGWSEIPTTMPANNVIVTGTFTDDSYVGGIYYNYSDTEVTVVSGANKYTGDVTIPASVSSGGKTYSVTSIGDDAFYGCSKLTSVSIPNSVKSIGERAFYNCYRLSSITIPNSVKSIGNSAFEYCSGLFSITIPNSVKSIGNWAFYDCKGLTSISVQEGNTKYDSRNNCNAIIETATNTLVTGCKNTIIPNNVTSIGYGGFWGCSGLTSVTIPNSVTSIGYAAFYKCSGLTSVSIPNSVTSIESSTFESCSRLTSVTMGSGVTSIGEKAFYKCSGLTSVTMGSGVTSIGDYAFCDCYRLSSITIPNSVTSIGLAAFFNCIGLTSIYSYIENPASVTGSNFHSLNYTNATLYIPYGTKNKYLATNGWKNFANIVEMDAPSAINGVNAEDAKSFVGKIIKDNKIIIMKNGKKHSVSGQGM